MEELILQLVLTPIMCCTMKYLLLLIGLWSFCPMSAQETNDTIVATQDTILSTRYNYQSKGRTKYHRAVRTRYGLVDFGVSAMKTASTYRLENGIDPFDKTYFKKNFQDNG